MAQGALKQAVFYFGGYDFSSDTKLINPVVTPDVLDKTNITHPARARRHGLDDISFNPEGFLNLGTAGLEDVIMSNFNIGDIPITLGFTGGAMGEPAHFFLSKNISFNFGGQVGDMLPYKLNAGGQGSKFCRGMFLHNAQRLVSGTSTPYQVGVVPAGKSLYAALHVIEITGAAPTLDVILQSDIAVGFEDPTLRITFDQKIAVGHHWATPVEGPILDGAEADDWWRISYTLAGTITSATFIVVMAIE